MPDIVGIGALNIDFIKERKSYSARDERIMQVYFDIFERTSESPAEIGEIKKLLNTNPSFFKTYFGGSAFNSIHALSRIGINLKLGYIGVAGKSYKGLDFKTEMENLKIDHTYVLQYSQKECGFCISLFNDGKRILTTCPNANTKLGEYIEKNFEELLEYLSKAKIIHITSLFDDISPKSLSKLIVKVKEKVPAIKISFDPGFHWLKLLTSNKLQKPILQIFKLSDFLFLNGGEFKLFTNNFPNLEDKDIAKDILLYCNSETVLIVQERYNLVNIYFQFMEEEIFVKCFETDLNLKSTYEDETGAGDVFVAGFLASMLRPILDLPNGILLGLDLVNEKLQNLGNKNYLNFRSVYSKRLGAIYQNFKYNESLDLVHGKKVFISYSYLDISIVNQIKNNLEDKNIDVKIDHDIIKGGNEIFDKLIDTIFDCDFFVIILSNNSIKSNWVKFEIRKALVNEFESSRTKIIPVRIDDCDTPKSLKGKHIIDFSTNDFSSGIKTLVSSISQRNV